MEDDQKELKIEVLLDTLAEFVADSSIFDEKVFAKRRGQLEAIAKTNIDDLLRTEIFVAELFVAQIPVQLFLKDLKRPDLVNVFFEDVFDLFRKRGYFKTEEGVNAFNLLVDQRFPEYYALVKADEFYTKAIARSICLRHDGKVYLEALLTSTLTNLVAAFGEFMQKTSASFTWRVGQVS